MHLFEGLHSRDRTIRAVPVLWRRAHDPEPNHQRRARHEHRDNVELVGAALMGPCGRGEPPMGIGSTS